MQWLKPSQLATFQTQQTTAHRICSGTGGWVERLGDDVLLSHKVDTFRDEVLAALPGWCAEAGWQPRRVFGKFLPKQNEDRKSPLLLSGDATLPLNTVVEEAGVKYHLDFDAGYSAGLFIDQRANRAFIRRLAPKRLLNTFAYTCSFSVVAALAGGTTVSADLSKKSLDRGKENFTLNGLDPAAGHRFFADDVLELLPRLARRGEKFDAIILDPPTFSRGHQGRRWQVESGMEDLLLAALDVAQPKARILLSTNCAKLEMRDLERMSRFCLKTQSRGADLHREPPLVDFPADHGARVLWLLLR